jgi:hypothetical protein
MAERHGRMLKRLGEMGMALAEETYEAALAAKDPQERERLKASFHRLSRSVRQARVQRRRAQVNAALTRLIWTEAERCDYGDLIVELTKILNEEALSEDFLGGPVEDLIARIKADLGFVDDDDDFPSPPPQGNLEAAHAPERRSSG